MLLVQAVNGLAAVLSKVLDLRSGQSNVVRTSHAVRRPCLHRPRSTPPPRAFPGHALTLLRVPRTKAVSPMESPDSTDIERPQDWGAAENRVVENRCDLGCRCPSSGKGRTRIGVKRDRSSKGG